MFKRFEKSFSAKLSLYVISFITLLSLVLFGTFYHYSTETLSTEAEEYIRNMADKANLRVSSLLSKVEKIPDNLGWVITKYVKEPDSLYSITKRIVEDNPEIFGCAMAFEPHYFSSKGYYFAPYSYTTDEGVKTMQIGSDDYNYFEKGWYRGAVDTDTLYWSKPYRDAGNPNVITTTCAVPMKDANQKLIGVLSVDLTNKWLRELIDSIQPYKNSYTLIIDQKGRYILRREGDEILMKTIFETAEGYADTNVRVLARRMSRGESGSIIVNDAGVVAYVYYTPVYATDWYMAVVCPYNEVFGRLSHFNMFLLIGFVVLLFFIYVVCFLAVRRITKPLKVFADSARNIAYGNFNTRLPVIRSKDEMGELYDSFLFMQKQLTEYIDQLRMTTTANEKIESELRIAHDIQLGMVPRKFTPITGAEGIDIYAVLRPARQVGGDLYDYLMLNEDEFAFAIGDVSGKGVPASLLMATTMSLLRSVVLRDTSLTYIVNFINHSLIRQENLSMFVTFFVGVLNLNTRQLRYCNAGHPYPIMIDGDGSVSFFKTTDNLPLGVTKDYEYEEQECYFGPESKLLLYTDGITEAQNELSQFYKPERLLETVTANKNLSPKGIVRAIISDVDAYAGKGEQSDDLTLMCLQYDLFSRQNAGELMNKEHDEKEQKSL